MIQAIKRLQCFLPICRRFSTSLDRVTRRGVNRVPLSISVGEVIDQFTLTHSVKVHPTNSTLLKFIHESGLRYYHIDSSSIDNTFAILVRNSPMDDSSVSYVLEKMLQCGCNKYRVKDAVEEMKNRSFNSTNQIVTTDEYFCFPFTTHTSKDFYNLIDVYMHMVFSPQLQYSDFLEVCGRFKFQNNNINNQLEFEGVAYAEALMHQQLLESILTRAINLNLLEHRFSSLGPSNLLPTLKYDQVKQHHKSYFTLNNTVLFTSGDMSPSEHISRIGQLIRAMNIPIKSPVAVTNSHPMSTDMNLPKTIRIQHMEPYLVFMLSFKLPALSTEESIRLQLLSYLLYDLPDSPFQKWLGVDLPYPRLYGMRGDTFNLGFCTEEQITDKVAIQHEKDIIGALKQITERGLPDALVELCLNHLESNSFSQDGIKILESLASYLMTGTAQSSLQIILNVPETLRRLQIQLRKKDIFAQLIQKFLLTNRNYIRIISERNMNLTEELLARNKKVLQSIKDTLSDKRKQEIIEYRPPSDVQDTSRLPLVQVADFEFLEETIKETVEVAGIKTTLVDGGQIPSITIRFDVTDLQDDYLNVLEIYCRALPLIGYKAIDYPTYQAFLDRFIHNVSLSYHTAKIQNGLKLYLFMKVEFLEKNTEFAFNILNGLLNRPNFGNISKLSESLRELTSELYNKASEDCIEYGVSYASSGINPFLQMEDISFHTRSACGVSMEMLKVTNPRHILEQLSTKLQHVHKKMLGRKRMEIFASCRSSSHSVIIKYLELVVGSIDQGVSPSPTNIESFSAKQIKAYLPNFNQGFVFESFPTSYLERDSPAVIVLAAAFNESLRRSKNIGGCVAYKGSLTAFIRGGQKQFLELEKYYFGPVDLDSAKRRLFQYYRQHSPEYEFKHGLSLDTIRFFKQAVLATTQAQVDEAREKYIGQAINKQISNMVVMGPHLDSYDALLKTGWTVERLIDETSLKMQSSAKGLKSITDSFKYKLIG